MTKRSNSVLGGSPVIETSIRSAKPSLKIFTVPLAAARQPAPVAACERLSENWVANCPPEVLHVAFFFFFLFFLCLFFASASAAKRLSSAAIPPPPRSRTAPRRVASSHTDNLPSGHILSKILPFFCHRSPVKGGAKDTK